MKSSLSGLTIAAIALDAAGALAVIGSTSGFFFEGAAVDWSGTLGFVASAGALLAFVAFILGIGGLVRVKRARAPAVRPVLAVVAAFVVLAGGVAMAAVYFFLTAVKHVGDRVPVH